VGIIIFVPLLVGLCAVAFIGTVAVAPRTYAVKKRLAVGCGVVVAILILLLLLVMMLVLRI
jgi:hypothetical protein